MDYKRSSLRILQESERRNKITTKQKSNKLQYKKTPKKEAQEASRGKIGG